MFYALDLKTAPPIVLEIYDHDTSVLDADDYIGRACIDVTHLFSVTPAAQERAHLARRHRTRPQLEPHQVQLQQGRADHGADSGLVLDRAARLQVQADAGGAAHQVGRSAR